MRLQRSCLRVLVHCLSTRTGLNCVHVPPFCLCTGEYIDDTEDLINIQLDYSRNKLIRFEIILTTGTFAIAIFSAVAGMLGENLALPEIITDVRLWASVGGDMGAVASGEVAVCTQQRVPSPPV